MSMTSHPEAFVGCDPNLSRQDCTLDTCCIAQSFFLYRPDYAGNVFFTAFFTVFILPQLFLGIKYRTWGFMAGMVIGLIFEAVGYGARIGLHIDPFSTDFFLIYLIMLTIAPVFITAAVYLCLSRIVVLYGAHLSPLKPRTIAILFMCSDFLSLVLQAVGGAMAQTAITGEGSATAGINIMIAGLLLQVVSLCFFSGVWAWFQIRIRNGIPDQNPLKVQTRTRAAFYAFTASLLLATAAIIVRSIYRVAELWSGFTGRLWNNEVDFMVLDGAMIALAVVLLTVLHPGLAFGGQWGAADWSFRRRKDVKT